MEINPMLNPTIQFEGDFLLGAIVVGSAVVVVVMFA